MKNIVWLASYPKSGNTWMRILLTNYLSGSPEPADINNLVTEAISSARHFIEKYLELNTSELDLAMIDRYRPDVFRAFSEETSAREAFIKAHEKYYKNAEGQPIFPTDVTKAVVYMVRDPRDVALSYADHLGLPLAMTIQIMNEPDSVEKHDLNRWHNQFEQPMGNWSEHVLSWTEQKAFPIIPVRYEDLLAEPLVQFKRVIEGIGFEWDAAAGEKAVMFSSFEQLKEQEQTKGFFEKSAQSNAFFRSGISGGWKAKLSREDAALIWQTHKVVMQKMGYTEDDQP